MVWQTIQQPKFQRASLEGQKLHGGETLVQVVDRLVRYQSEDDYLDEQTLSDMQEGLDDIWAGRAYTKELKAKLEL